MPGCGPDSVVADLIHPRPILGDPGGFVRGDQDALRVHMRPDALVQEPEVLPPSNGAPMSGPPTER